MKKNIRMATIAGALTLGIFTAGQAEAATPTCNVPTQTVKQGNVEELEYNNDIQTAEPQAPVTEEKAPAAEPKAPVEAPQQPQQTEQKAEAGSVSAFEQQVFELVNQERAKQGVSPLQLDTKLSDVARTKSQDMKNKGYFSHQSPTYGSPFDMMKQFGITYKAAGENIAKGQQTPEEVMDAWMNSDGHRKNILSADFTHIGVGYVDGHWTQMFIGK
ncbi:CAP domain-containing protein [Bacillus sp. 37MA]|uniref:CAP domain-containing protein n=1 Tax=Bacillus sp. 37MA TaxID=1132442 RepID=UPI000362138B|nr:CAP domain-containing protein [Bacillus sp. 37MA]